MKIHEIPGDPGKKQTKKRVGRGEGSGLGRTSGKGNKGQQARTGRLRLGAFEGGQMPLSRRMPKRGFNNSDFKVVYEIVNVSRLSAAFKDGETADPDSLVEKNIIKKKTSLIKILGDGNIEKKLTVKAHRFSKSAIEKITAKGGSCEEIK